MFSCTARKSPRITNNINVSVTKKEQGHAMANLYRKDQENYGDMMGHHKSSSWLWINSTYKRMRLRTNAYQRLTPRQPWTTWTLQPLCIQVKRVCSLTTCMESTPTKDVAKWIHLSKAFVFDGIGRTVHSGDNSIANRTPCTKTQKTQQPVP